MISWIIFFTGVIVSIVSSIVVNHNKIAYYDIILIFIIALFILILINVIMAILCCKWLPEKWFNKDSNFYSPSKREIKFYEKLGVKAWKDKTVEWGKLNGFSKSKVENPKDPSYLEKFILECNKGFLDHLLSIFASAIIFLVVPKCCILTMALPMFITSVMLNLMPVIILRYNVYRLKRALVFLQRNKKENDIVKE